MNRCSLYAPLVKTQVNDDDDSVSFSGIASSESKDSAGEIILAAAMEAALPEYFAYGTGNLREMHGLSAAGVIDSASVDRKTGQTKVTGAVVDPVACKKLKAGVYKGLSIGGKVLERDKKDKSIITKLKLVEISLVDRPACPEAVLELYKAEGFSAPPASAHPTLSREQVRAGLDALSAEELVFLLTKTSLALPRSIKDLVGRHALVN